MRAPINSVKHYVQLTLATIAMAALGGNTFATSVERTTANAGNEVTEGSIIKAVYVEYWIQSDDANQSSFVLSVEKVPANATQMTYAQSIALHTYPNKKNILYTTMGIVGGLTNNNAVPVIRQWIKIPKSKQRMGLGDRLRMNISGISNGIDICGFVTFKEYF